MWQGNRYDRGLIHPILKGDKERSMNNLILFAAGVIFMILAMVLSMISRMPFTDVTFAALFIAGALLIYAGRSEL